MFAFGALAIARSEVHVTVERLESEATAKQVELEEKQNAAREALHNIKRAMRAAAERKQEASLLHRPIVVIMICYRISEAQSPET